MICPHAEVLGLRASGVPESLSQFFWFTSNYLWTTPFPRRGRKLEDIRVSKCISNG
jgi:hypothetical protein